MKKFTPLFLKTWSLLLFLALSHLANSQNSPQSLSIKDFAIWGGSTTATSFDKKQGVFLKEKATIIGSIGSNHLIDAKEKLTLTGNIYSGNGIDFKEETKVTGDVFALRSASDFKNPVISGKEKSVFTGNLTAKGIIDIKSGSRQNATTISGQVFVPSPSSTNYKGPAPLGGISNSVELPVLPTMPNITPFDNQAGTQNITNNQTIAPGRYRKLELKGNRTVTFDGPGNYIFDEISNSGNNNTLVFNLKNTTEGTINLFIVKNARLGKVSVKTINGDFTSRIFTEVHGTGTPGNGFAFDIEAPSSIPGGNYLWLGNVWATNGGISVKGLKPSNQPHIIGALWSTTLVDIKENLYLKYEAPSPTNLNYIEPYYAPPAQGKVAPANEIIGAELTSLSQNPSSITAIPDNDIFRFDNEGKVMIEVISKTANDNTLKNQLIALGMTGIIDNGPHVFVITGFFPINLLPQLNSNPLIEYVRPLYPPILSRGLVTTQGDITMRSNLVRERFGLDGEGVKIGVISDSYNNKMAAQNDVDQGDLPGLKTTGDANENEEPVQVLQDLSGGGIDEGRAMLQITHDIAPKSKLAFRTGFLSAGDFARGIRELADPGLAGGKCDIIVDDLSYITEPFFRDGIVAQVVDEVSAQGVTYVTSAGNFGKKSYESTFNGVTNTAVIPSPAQIHQFGNDASEIYQSVLLKPGSYTIVLQWDDEFHSLGDDGVQTDLDLYLVGANGFTLFGFNRSNLFKDPFEVCPFTVKEETTAKIMVVRASGNNNVRFKYIIFRGDATILDYNTGNSTIVGHANSNGAISVGAMLYDNIPPFTPVWPGVASFSSRGGTSVLENNTFITRNKPDIIAPNGVNTTVNLGGPFFNDGDNFPNFFGTSAAAPHVAGVGALLMQGRKKFNLQTTVTPAEIRQQLISSAGKFDHLTGNFNFEGGFGFVQADNALLEIANARPIVDTLIAVTPDGQNGNEPFMVKVKGQYLTETTQIYAEGLPVPTTISADKTEATAVVSAILPGEDPPFQLFNAAKSPSGEDGGLSEAVFFFSETINITIKAKNKTRKYGQTNPEFDLDVFVDGLPIGQSNLSLADLKLDAANIIFNTIAVPESRPGIYGIFPTRTTPLDETDTLLTSYRFSFVPGSLTIEKMPLKITPQNKRLKYGEFPGDITYTYELDESLDNLPTLLDEVKELHKEFLADNGLVVIKGFEEGTAGVTAADFANMSTLTSFQSVLNAKKYLLQNGQLKALVNNIDPAELGDQRFIVNAPVEALVNYKADRANATMVENGDENARAFLNLKALSSGSAKAALPNGQLRAMVNGQLMAMVNGQLQARVNGQLRALVNGVFIDAEDIVFQNNQLRALVNGEWLIITNGQLRALVNGEDVDVDLSISNGQLRAIVNGQLMAMVNGQLQAMVNGQLLALVNGQLRALVNGQLMPLVNGQLMAIVNGQLKAMVNGQLLAIVNGQLMALVNGELEEVTGLSLVNGQLRALVNGQLRALVNGQLKAMVNGVVTDIPTNTLSLVNGQLRVMVNGQLRALVNGQLKALVNGQLRALVNAEGIEVESVIQLANGQLRALVNGTKIPIRNGQLKALVNGQLLAMVNGQLMAIVNGEVTFAVFQNGQLRALVNGQLQPLVNGQLKALVNGNLQTINSYTIANGQLKALVNGEEWVYPNGQLKALVNGQLKALVNNFDVSGENNNTNTVVVVDENDLELQGGDVGGMFSMAMITGLDAGIQTLVPGAFLHESFEVTYGTAEVEILPAPLFITAVDTSRYYGDENPTVKVSGSGFAYDEDESVIGEFEASFAADITSPIGQYPIDLSGFSLANYTPIITGGTLTINKAPLLVKADNKTMPEGGEVPQLTISYTGLKLSDTKESVCLPFAIPPAPKVIEQLERTSTYTNISLNGGGNVYNATPGQTITLTGNRFTQFTSFPEYCPGCITQLYIGMARNSNENVFADCYDVSGVSSWTQNINRTFTAPTQPGVYYITQITTWWFFCNQFGIPIHNNGALDALAVVVVGDFNNGNQEITAVTAATPSSPSGNYPITLQGCTIYNPNYEVTLEDGEISILPLIVGGVGGSSVQMLSAIQEESKLEIFENKIFPNPAKNAIRVHLKDDVVKVSDIQVYGQTGQLNKTSTRKIDSGIYEVNISALPAGMYFLRAQTVNGPKTLKFLKM